MCNVFFVNYLLFSGAKVSILSIVAIDFSLFVRGKSLFSYNKPIFEENANKSLKMEVKWL